MANPPPRITRCRRSLTIAGTGWCRRVRGAVVVWPGRRGLGGPGEGVVVWPGRRAGRERSAGAGCRGAGGAWGSGRCDAMRPDGSAWCPDREAESELNIRLTALSANDEICGVLVGGLPPDLGWGVGGQDYECAPTRPVRSGRRAGARVAMPSRKCSAARRTAGRAVGGSVWWGRPQNHHGSPGGSGPKSGRGPGPVQEAALGGRIRRCGGSARCRFQWPSRGNGIRFAARGRAPRHPSRSTRSVRRQMDRHGTGAVRDSCGARW